MENFNVYNNVKLAKELKQLKLENQKFTQHI